ncbi:D-ribulokinase [Bradyrhizobium sp. USDA 313]
MPRVYIGVDVGTTSTRAGVFDEGGTLLAAARHPINIWHEAGDIVEQSSHDIWKACVTSVRAAMTEAAIAPDSVGGIGFDATCSLAVLDRQGEPLTVSASGDPQRNVIVWMDHRATAEARLINETEDAVLRYVGGSISPEMEMPKLLWLKRHLRASFDAAGHFFDLADYLTWRATGSLQRSTCTVTCKWNYLAHDGGGWSAPFFRRIGLSDFVAEKYARIGTEIVAPGTRVGAGLTRAAAAEFGLAPGTPVGASLIDAHAGGIGAIGGRDGAGGASDVSDRLAYIMGTSACIMATTKEPCFVPGVWGPYYSGMVPDFWLNEGGQSAAGAAIDHLLKSHPGFGEASVAARSEGLDLIDFLERRIIARAGDASRAALLARDVHVLPEFIGNRSPHADPDTRAVIAGLDLDTDIGSMERLFVAGLCGLCLWARRGDRDLCRAWRAVQPHDHGRRRQPQPAGAADHGRYDRSHRRAAADEGAGAAGRRDAGRSGRRRLCHHRRDHGRDVGAGTQERADCDRHGRVSRPQARGLQAAARGRSRQPRRDAQRRARLKTC